MTRAPVLRRAARLLGLAVLAGGLGMGMSGSDVREGLKIGDTPPAFTATDLQGRQQSLQRHRGGVVLLHFWATWCPYCRSEIPKLEAIHAQGVVVLSVSVDEDLEALRRFVAQSDLPYPVIADANLDRPLSVRYEVRGIPTTYILGSDGRIRHRFSGNADLVEAVQLLQEDAGS